MTGSAYLHSLCIVLYRVIFFSSLGNCIEFSLYFVSPGHIPRMYRLHSLSFYSLSLIQGIALHGQVASLHHLHAIYYILYITSLRFICNIIRYHLN